MWRDAYERESALVATDDLLSVAMVVGRREGGK